MKVRLWSDIHLEFGDMVFTPRDDDHETVLVIAGDFHVGTRSFEYLRSLCSLFKAVVYVPGNHEYYGEVIDEVDHAIQKLADGLENLHFLNPGTVIIDGVKFVGATMWTDFNKADPYSMFMAARSMNDYRRIRYINSEGKEELLNPEVVVDINAKHRSFFHEELSKEFDGKVVAVTHHPPLEECTKTKFYRSDDPLVFAYANTGLEEMIECCDFWFHGHIHDWMHVSAHGCEIIAKPRGYIGHQNCAKYYDLTSKDAEIIVV